MTFSAKYLDYLELQAPIHVYGATQQNVNCKRNNNKKQTLNQQYKKEHFEVRDEITEDF